MPPRWSDIEHDIEGAPQGTRLQGAGGFQGHDQGLALGRVADAVEGSVSGVAALAGHVHLRRQPAGARRVHLEVDVRRAARIGDGADGAEAVAAVRRGLGTPVALKVCIAPLQASLGGWW